ncbi:PREDICTED: Retrovirus-related Pol poly from transposon [Prunus dulcis]|uniref:PREDICTED: Retrovirus-related Pol poly from transposon n=1 Tax=Prunus dulcis TaxID=3755 RepID=A0A5E4G590_PRUDU|nr:PREDICTED: Retrovirus-related Pol poly from transposon [Prunus dulcis]
MVGAKPCSTIVGFVKLDRSEELLPDPTSYRSIVGALQCIAWTRPYISFIVGQLCQFMHSTHLPHFQAAKRLLRYLKGTIHQRLLFQLGTPIVQAFCDADWANGPFDRLSTSGFCVFFGSNLIFWSSKKHPTAARNSTQAEYCSLAHTSAELI